MRKGRDGGKKREKKREEKKRGGKKQGKKRREKTDENSGHYVIASRRPPKRRPLERRTLAPKTVIYNWQNSSETLVSIGNHFSLPFKIKKEYLLRFLYWVEIFQTFWWPAHKINLVLTLFHRYFMEGLTLDMRGKRWQFFLNNVTLFDNWGV